MFFACGIWCVADVSSVSPSSEQSNHKQNNRAYCVIAYFEPTISLLAGNVAGTIFRQNTEALSGKSALREHFLFHAGMIGPLPIEYGFDQQG